MSGALNGTKSFQRKTKVPRKFLTIRVCFPAHGLKWDGTYDQLIKRGTLAHDLLPSKTSTYAPSNVPQFVDLRVDNAFSVLLGGCSNGTVVYRYGLSLSNIQLSDRMCIKLVQDTHHANEHCH
jgi:hypothetical protein